jgi:opacity protein-like surface antigen
MGLNWSDAHIGEFLSIPPHFGAGVSGGITTMDVNAVEGLLREFDVNLDLPLMPMPGYTAEGRIGGFFLPFDIGVKIGALPDVALGNVKINYLLAGGDIRYAVLKQGILLPNLSIGVGVNYMRGGISTPFGSDVNFSYEYSPGVTHTIGVSNPTARLNWQTTVLELKAQVSKTFLIITPYVGAGVSYAWSETGYGVNSTLTYDDGSGAHPITNPEAESLEHAMGLDDVERNGFSSEKEAGGFGVRLFGGFSLNLAMIKLDFTAMFNVLDQNWGGTLGVRFQL